jgi:hypothetical protein
VDKQRSPFVDECPTFKTCTNCGEAKLLDEFYRAKDKPFGRQSWCKSCKTAYFAEHRADKAEYDRGYREMKGDTLREQKAHYAAMHRDDKREYDRQYRSENADRIRTNKRAYAEANREAVLAKKREWYQQNRESILSRPLSEEQRSAARERAAAWYRDNHERAIAAQSARERRLKAESPTYRLRKRMTNVIWRSLRAAKAGRSWTSLIPYGLDELAAHLQNQFADGMSWENMGRWHIDHIYPASLFRYTSPDDVEFAVGWSLTNLRPMWGPENSAKNDRLPNGRTARSLTKDERERIVTSLILEWVPPGEGE